MAIAQNITFYLGEDVTVTATMTPTTDITGWTIVFTMRLYNGATVLLQKTGTVTSGAGGIFTIAFDSADTADMDPGAYPFDIQRTDSGHQTVLTVGELELKAITAQSPIG